MMDDENALGEVARSRVEEKEDTKKQQFFNGPIEQTPPSDEAKKKEKVLDDYINS